MPRFAILDSLTELPHHASLCFRAKHTVMRQEHISKEIDALLVFEERIEFFTACRDDHEVIRVPDEVFDPECMFDELIELVEVDIGKELRSKIADRDSLPPEEFGILGKGTPDDFTEQRNGFLILYPSSDDMEEYVMIDGSKELMDVAFENKAWACPVPAHTF